MPIPTNKDIAEVTYNGVTIPLAESGGGEAVQEIFDVTYGTTPFEDIDAAYQAGKICRLVRSGEIYFLTKFSTNSVLFWYIGTGGVRKFVACSSDNVWQSANANVQTSSSKVTEITDTSTDAQYPSAKAVYDLVQSSGGGGVSEVFRVVYGTTPFADTYAALQNGKICVTEWIGDMYYCCHYDDDIIVFKFSGNNADQQLIMCNPSNQWQLLNITLGIDSITGLRSEFGYFAEALDGINGVINSKISCTDAQVASYGYLKLSDLPVWDGSVV